MRRGLRDYRVAESGELRQDLQRQNLSIEALLSDVRREKLDRWRWRRVVTDSATAQFGEALRISVGAERIRIRLPAGDYGEQGKRVLLVLDGDGEVAVRGINGQINGADTDELTNVGTYLYEWEGSGWWRQGMGSSLSPSTLTELDTLMTIDSTIVWASRTYEPQVVSANTVGLWRLATAGTSQLADQSPNGNDLTVADGTRRGASIWPGMGGVYFDGTFGLRGPVGATSLRLTGDMTVAFITSTFVATGAGAFVSTVANPHLFAHMTQGETEDTNQLYGLQFTTFPIILYRHERGAGTNDDHTWGSSDEQGVWPSFYTPLMVHFVRRSGVAELYFQGVDWVPFSTAKLAPTGGTSGRFTIGCSLNGAGGTFANGYSGIIADFLIENRAWTYAEIRANYNRCMGPVMGRRASL